MVMTVNPSIRTCSTRRREFQKDFPDKVRVLNPVLFDRINEGETGTAVVKGNLLVSFNKEE